MARDPYRRLHGGVIYRNPWLSVERHAIVHPGGARGEHVLVVTPPTCAVLVEDGDHLVFARQARFAARRRVIEIVKGGAESNETLLRCAKRELREELGVTARRWSRLGRLSEIPSIVAGAVTLYLASDPVYGAPTPERVESIAPVRLRAAAAIAKAIDGEIDDAVTVAALFRYAAARGWLKAAATRAAAEPTRGSSGVRVSARRR